MSTRFLPAALPAMLLLLVAVRAAPADDWRVDFGRVTGTIRPLHGVNGGPLCYRGVIDLRESHRRLGIPLTRLHDTVWVNAEAVDVHTIFRDFRDDPADPANYDFRATDDYVRAVLDTGAGVVFRLGESIEHTPRKYWVNSPPDPARWAAICEGIVRHYEEAWAGGLRGAVRYWEIWNEPDVRPAMWTGTDDEFLRLFELAARAIKARFPAAKVGGPGLGGVGDFAGEEFRPSPFLLKLLRHCRESAVPLDFFSWHRYASDSASYPKYARAVRRVLDEAGFRQTESHLNEWNYLPDNDWTPMLKDGQGAIRERWYARMNGAEGAAFAISVLLRLQDSPVDAANYYTGEIQGFGLFDIHGAPRRTWHAFRLFRDLLDCPRRINVTPEGASRLPASPVVVAGRNDPGTRGVVLIANDGKAAVPMTLRVTSAPGGEKARWQAVALSDAGEGEVLGEGALGADASIAVRVPGPGVVRVALQ